MQKRILFLWIGLVFSLQTNAQTDWQVEQIDAWFGVSFPGVAQQEDTFGQRLLYLEQDSLVFFVSKASGKTPNVTDVHKLDEYYDGLVNGFVDQTGARLLDETALAMGPLKGRNIRVAFSYPTTESGFGPLRDSAASIQEDIRQVHFLLVNGHTYVLQYWYSKPASESKISIGEQFFASFIPLQEVNRDMQFAESEGIDKGLKPWLGEGVLYIGLMLLIAFVYMLVRYAVRSRSM